MDEFFTVSDLDTVLSYTDEFQTVATEETALTDAIGRVLSVDIMSDVDLPAFNRSTMDGYAVRAASTFGASESNPAYLSVKGSVAMGESSAFGVGPGEAARISTGGMLPAGTDSVVMIEHTEAIDGETIEVYRSVAPGQHVVQTGEDFRRDERILFKGQKLRAQEVGLLAALGNETVPVFKKPRIGVISTGDEIIPITQKPKHGQIRDMNTYTLSSQVRDSGAVPVSFGIVRDNYADLSETCTQALNQTDMVLISGGSSVGVRDYTIDVLSALPDSRILAHGISISPGKPTILAKSGNRAVWGLPGHVVSAMVVFATIVRPFVEHVGGISTASAYQHLIPARLRRNIPSAQGRVDFVRVKLNDAGGILWADPVLGKSGLINTMVKADGLIKVDMNTEGLEKDTLVHVIPF